MTNDIKDTPRPALSVVTTMYNSAPYLEEFYNRTVTAVEALFGDDFELIFVNDGSPDNSLDIAFRLHQKDPRVKIQNLSRNFGHHKAMMAGLARATGHYTFLIDCDLEEPPELLGTFWETLNGQPKDSLYSVDVVYGVQKKRKGSWFEKFSGDAFFTVFGALSSLDLPRNVVTARLMRRQYVDALVAHRDSEMFIASLWSITGFNQVAVPIVKSATSPTNYSLLVRSKLAINAILSFSTIPLRGIAFIGLLIVLLSGFAAVFVAIRALLGDVSQQGWTSLIIAIVFFGGANLLCTGILGLYISIIFSEVKKRPNTITKEWYER